MFQMQFLLNLADLFISSIHLKCPITSQLTCTTLIDTTLFSWVGHVKLSVLAQDFSVTSASFFLCRSVT